MQRFRLGSGLRVVVNAERTKPTVAVCLLYDVGARDETSQEDGAAHVVRRALRSASTTDGQLSALVEARNGSLETYGLMDRTRLCTLLPSSELEFGVWVASRQLLRGPIEKVKRWRIDKALNKLQ